jgi:nicotinamide-nucleotide amidase
MSLSCEVLAVGTELLLGQIVDTNSNWIGEQLALNGIACHRQVKVGDNLARIVECLREALDRSDAVIVCGGLGPTHDDITREAIAEVMGVGLHHDEEVAERIREMFAARGRRMADNNLRQAQVPDGAAVIPQTRGTAPGLVCPVRLPGSSSEKVAYLVPGVPHEMKDMLERVILADLRRRSGDASVIVSRTLRTWGESESGLNERLDGIIGRLDAVGNPTLAFLASGWEGIKVRLTARATTPEAALALIAPIEAEIRTEVGIQVFGTDDDTMESVVLQMLRDRGLSLGLAESVTGGLVSGRLTAVPGASDVLRGAIVSYASEVKFDVLGVPRGPVVNEETAVAMAAGARRVLGADVGIGLTGVAGPSEQDGMSVGTLCLGLVIGDDAPVSTTLRLPGQRQQMREFSVISALDLLRRTLLGRS